MKTSEFIKKLDEHREKVINVENIFSDDELYLTSIKTNQFNITFYYDEEPNGILDIIAEYLNTPAEEREEEKKYYLKIKFSSEKETYLCAYDFWSDWKLIDKDELKHGDEFYFKFTQKQIDEMPGCYTHPAVWEQIEVESEEE